VRVAVLTYRRPADLAQLLPRLVEQARAVSDQGTSADVVVVDNDPDGSAAALVAGFAAVADGVRVHYEHEPVPGIAAARNRALRTASAADLLVFIDDDERPCADWLRLLLDTHARHRSAAVVGPVVSGFAAPPPDWVTAGRFFERLRRPTGSTVAVAATNNLLLDLRQLRRLGCEFDQEFGLSGGSDTLFTRQLHRGGGRLVWCDEAVVTDVVPPERATRSWVLRRALRSGNSWSRTTLALAGTPAARLSARLRLSVAAVVRLLAAAARTVVGVVARSQAQRARGARTAARGLGLLGGAWGYVYQEYRRPPVTPTARSGP
jgi:glycosyltransferase involved in cell wall biosynthesis